MKPVPENIKKLVSRYRFGECWKVLSFNGNNLVSPYYRLKWTSGKVEGTKDVGISVYLDPDCALKNCSRYHNEVVVPVYFDINCILEVSEDLAEAYFSFVYFHKDNFKIIIDSPHENYVNYLFGYWKLPKRRHWTEIQDLFFREI